MGFLSSLLMRSALSNPPNWMVELFGGRESASGTRVTEQTALYASPVFAGTRLIADTIGSMPFLTYKRQPDGGKVELTDHPVYPLLAWQPNPEMHAKAFRAALSGHTVLRGNGFAEIQRDRTGTVLALWPLRPDRVTVTRDDQQRLVYDIRVPDGSTQRLMSDQVLHVRGLGPNGLMGYSVFDLMREAIGMVLATEEFGARFFGNSARPGGILQVPADLDLEDGGRERLRQDFELAQGGLSNAHRIAILEEGITFQQVGIAPEDAQFLETRKFQVREIARALGVPPHLLFDLEQATFSNIEMQSLEFVIYFLTPRLVDWEQEVRMKLFSPAERKLVFSEHLVASLLRGDSAARATAYHIMRQDGVINADEWRAMEGFNPQPDGTGKVYLWPLNMVPAGAKPTPAPAPASDSLPKPAPGGPETPRTALPAPSGPGAAEARAARSAATRRRLRGQYARLFDDAFSRVLSKERTDVLQKANSILTKRDAQVLQLWLADYYADHGAFVQDRMAPVVTTYGEQVNDAAAEEVNATPDPGEMTAFLAAYTASLARRYVGYSMSRITNVLNEALAGNLSGDDTLAALTKLFDEWKASRPADLAQEETVRAGDAVTLTTYEKAGITEYRWQAFGNSCAYCSDLDGRVVGITETFLSAGEPFQPDGAPDALTPSTNIRHAPAHRACDCTVVAEQGQGASE